MNLRPVSLRALCGEWPAGVVQPGVCGMLAIFGACLAGLLVATWAGWQELGYAVFFMASSLTVYYARAGSLLPVVLSAPLLFLLACLTASVLMPSLALLPTLAGAAWWLLASMILTVVIGLARGLHGEVRDLWAGLRRLPGAKLARKLEGHLLLDGLDFLHVREAEGGQLAEDAVDELFGDRCPGGDAHRDRVTEPALVDLAGVIDEVGGARAGVLRHLDETDGVGGIARPDDDNHVGAGGDDLHGCLPVLRRVADVIAGRVDQLGEAVLQRGDRLDRLIH
jgi:hypothetical protein